MSWIIRRFKEPSTWRGLIILAGIAGYNMSPELSDQIVALGTGAIGLVEIIRREKDEIAVVTEGNSLNENDSVRP
jgi:PII-like signaling protein